MKRLCAVIVGLLVLMPIHRAVSDKDADTKANYFAKNVAMYMDNNGRALSEEEQEILRKAHPILLRIADNESLLRAFWLQVRQSKSEEIDWDQAKVMILRGDIEAFVQGLSREIHLTGRGGRVYTTKEPKKDDIHRVTKKIDPMGIFMPCLVEVDVTPE